MGVQLVAFEAKEANVSQKWEEAFFPYLCLWQIHETCIFGAAKGPATQVAVPPLHSALGQSWGRAAAGKKVVCLCAQDRFGRVQLFVTW